MARNKMPRKGTVRHDLISCDWSDLTVTEIGEVLDRDAYVIRAAIRDIKAEYGIEVKYKPDKLGLKKVW